MRKTHPLSQETIKVMSGNVSRIAEEMDVEPQYVYGILSGVNADRFAQFSFEYAACLRAGAPVCHWDNRLAAIRARYEKNEPTANAFNCLATKIKTDAFMTSQMVDALKDGQIDAVEAKRLMESIKAERDVLNLIETTLQFVVTEDLPPSRKYARAAVARFGSK
jgi:hypothetical protein